jgi:hypothetical protein
VLAISASVAYAITVAVAGVPFAGDAQTPGQPARADACTSSAGAALADGDDVRARFLTALCGGSITSTAAVDGAGSGEACDTTGGRLLYIGLNSWIPAETGAARCPDGIPSTP